MKKRQVYYRNGITGHGMCWSSCIPCTPWQSCWTSCWKPVTMIFFLILWIILQVLWKIYSFTLVQSLHFTWTGTPPVRIRAGRALILACTKSQNSVILIIETAHDGHFHLPDVKHPSKQVLCRICAHGRNTHESSPLLNSSLHTTQGLSMVWGRHCKNKKIVRFYSYL